MTEEWTTAVVRQLIDYAFYIGLTVRPPPTQAQNEHNALMTHAPARGVQTAYNTLYKSISQNTTFLLRIISAISKVDDFTRQLYDIHLAVLAAGGYKHKLALGVFRSDYLLQTATGASSTSMAIKQVEFNTVSVSFGGLSSRVAQTHNHLARLGFYGDDSDYVAEETPVDVGIARELNHAALAYEETFTSDRPSVVLFIVQPGERNVMDQRAVEYKLLEFGRKSYRVTLAEAATQCVRDPNTGRLGWASLPGSEEQEVSVVYFRAGYAPDDYPTAVEWNARTLLEESRAVKCPTILTHLAGAKKIQQVLAEPGCVEKFMSSQEAVQVRSTFAELHTLDESPEGLRARELAFSHPEKYVLKPQREGGGNNVYRKDIPKFLSSLPPSHWEGYILMELIEPPPRSNTIVRAGITMTGEVIDELGIFGGILWDVESGRVLRNTEFGYLCRTKGRDSDEGGVAAGFGAIGAIRLV